MPHHPLYQDAHQLPNSHFYSSCLERREADPSMETRWFLQAHLCIISLNFMYHKTVIITESIKLLFFFSFLSLVSPDGVVLPLQLYCLLHVFILTGSCWLSPRRGWMDGTFSHRSPRGRLSEARCGTTKRSTALYRLVYDSAWLQSSRSHFCACAHYVSPERWNCSVSSDERTFFDKTSSEGRCDLIEISKHPFCQTNFVLI